MRKPWLVLLFLTLLILGGVIGVFFSSVAPQAEEAPQTVPQGAAPGTRPLPELGSDPVRVPDSFVEAKPITYPVGTIPGEITLRFSSRRDFQAYLAALTQAGFAPLGQIDELLVIRVGEEALSVLDPLRYGALPDYSYKIERPRPPERVDPEALASLEAFGRSARAIVGGPLEGDGSGRACVGGSPYSGIEAHPQFDDVYDACHIDLVGPRGRRNGLRASLALRSLPSLREPRVWRRRRSLLRGPRARRRRLGQQLPRGGGHCPSGRSRVCG